MLESGAVKFCQPAFRAYPNIPFAILVQPLHLYLWQTVVRIVVNERQMLRTRFNGYKSEANEPHIFIATGHFNHYSLP
jgi:hypothetical protein